MSTEFATFARVADCLLGALEGQGEAWTSSFSELGRADGFPGLFDRLPPDSQREITRLLKLMETSPGGVALWRKPRGFSGLDQQQRVNALRTMSRSRIGQIRQGFAALKLLTTILYTTGGNDEVSSPVWDAMGYPGPDGRTPNVPKPLEPIDVGAPADWLADVVVIGSGAGGGVAAGVLASTGLDVVVLEKGGYFNESDFSHLEGTAYRDMYLEGTLKGTADSGFVMLAGSTLGGGTTVNYTTSFETPPGLRSEWDATAGFREVFGGTAYEESSVAVGDRLGVNEDFDIAPNRDVLMEKGLRELGWHVDTQPRNVSDCTPQDCGWCGMGCRRGSKASTASTWLQDAYDHGARIVVGAEVDEILIAGGRATGVRARVNGHELTVVARAVVVAAGALNTPAILARSGAADGAVGRYLRLHPVTAVWGRFEEPVDPWTGIMQTRYSDQFADLDGAGYGFKFETAPVHPLFLGIFFGWESSKQFKRDLFALRHWSPVGVLVRDRHYGRVKVRRDGTPRWEYGLSKHDTGHLRTGVHRAAQVLAAAGAKEILASTSRPVRWRPGDQASMSGFIDEVDSVGFGPNQMTYLSFHQMGSARMGSDSRTSVVDESNRVHGTRGLYVMDGSCFPTASGVNPMVTIETIAHRGATMLAGTLT